MRAATRREEDTLPQTPAWTMRAATRREEKSARQDRVTTIRVACASRVNHEGREAKTPRPNLGTRPCGGLSLSVAQMERTPVA